MVDYRRYRIPGTWVFFTHALHDRRRQLLTEHIDLLRDAYNVVHARWPFRTVAFVVLPDHLHCIWSLPGNDTDYPGRWRMIKSRFTRLLRLRGVPVGVRSHGECCVWQRRYWEHTLHTEDDLRTHVDYIHGNPLKHGWVAQMADWPYSSFHAYTSRDGGGP
jgi:putative transposase